MRALEEVGEFVWTPITYKCATYYCKIKVMKNFHIFITLFQVLVSFGKIYGVQEGLQIVEEMIL